MAEAGAGGGAGLDARRELQAAIARLPMRPLIDLDADEARDELARASAATLALAADIARTVAPARGDTGRTAAPARNGSAAHGGSGGARPAGRRARRPARGGHGGSAGRTTAARRTARAAAPGGATAAERFLARWRGEADPARARALDAYWITAAEHGSNASTFTARVVASTGADVGAALSAAVGALSGPLHGGAPARVLAMLDEVERGRRRDPLREAGPGPWRAADGLRPSRLPRRGPARAGAAADRGAARSAARETATALEHAALQELQARKPDRVLATNVEFWSAVILDYAQIPPSLFLPLFVCARTAGWSAHILEQQRSGRLVRPTAAYVGEPPRPLPE